MYQDIIGGYPLELWRSKAGFHPYWFWQVYAEREGLKIESCGTVIYEYAWQRQDQLGRYEVRMGIDDSIRQIARELAYYPLPTEITEQVVVTPQFGGCQILRLKWPKVQTIGYYTYELTATYEWDVIVPVDLDGDGFDESGFILLDAPVTQTVFDSMVLLNDTIELANEPLTSAEVQATQIYPLTPRYTDGEIDGFYFPVAQSLSRSYRNSLIVSEVSLDLTLTPADISKLGDVYLYTRSVSTDGAVTAHYQSSCDCTDTTSQEVTRTLIIDAESGYIQIYMPCSCCAPYQVDVRYIAGAELTRWLLPIAQLSTANLTRELCNCEMANRTITYWQNDYADPPENQSFNISEANLGNPFGTRVGQIYAWQAVVNSKKLRSILI